MDNVFRRIDKLLRMAASGSGATEAEANTAAEMVQRILQDNGLTMAEIEARGESTGADGKRSKSDTDRRALFRWQRDLMANLAENFFCMHRVEERNVSDGRKMRKSKQHVLIGRWVNVQSTINMYDYLSTAIKRAADEHGFFHAAATEKQHHMFLEGATERLRERLARRKYEREVEQAKARDDAKARGEAAAGTALVLADVYVTEQEANEDILNGLEPGTTTRNRLRVEAEKRERDRKREEMVAQGVEYYEAWYRSYGYDVEAARRLSREYRAVPTEPAKARRKSRASGSSNWYRYTKEDARRDSTAYRAGSSAADNIGLDDQVTHTAKRRIA